MAPPQVVALSGELDAYAVPALSATLAECRGPVVLDLAHVRLITASAIGQFIVLGRRVGFENVTLCNASEPVARVLVMVGLDRVFRLEPAASAPGWQACGVARKRGNDVPREERIWHVSRRILKK